MTLRCHPHNIWVFWKWWFSFAFSKRLATTQQRSVSLSLSPQTHTHALFHTNTLIPIHTFNLPVSLTHLLSCPLSLAHTHTHTPHTTHTHTTFWELIRIHTETQSYSLQLNNIIIKAMTCDDINPIKSFIVQHQQNVVWANRITRWSELPCLKLLAFSI